MQRHVWTLFALTLLGTSVKAQEEYIDGGQFLGSASVGSNEQLFSYDDQERWKHGYIKMMPYYHGYHTFRPYNYHHVFGQSTTAQGFGMSPVMPYSQQFWHRYEKMADLSQGNHEPVYPSIPPVEENSHYPKPIDEAAIPGQPSASLTTPYRGMPQQNYYAPQQAPNYSQIFQPMPQPSQIAPVQYQNMAPYQNNPAINGPALPAPGYRY